jgi:PAS domain S-box-containing protein
VEQKLQKSQEKYRNVVEHSNDGICIVQDYEVKYTNPRLAEILGYSREEMIDHAIEKYLHPDNIRKINDIYDNFIRREMDEQRIETVMLHKNGYSIDVEMSISMTTYDERPLYL